MRKLFYQIAAGWMGAALLLAGWVGASPVSGAPVKPVVYLPFVGQQSGAPLIPLELLANSSKFVDSEGNLHLVGELFNHTDHYLTNISISASFLGQNNDLLATIQSNTYLNTLSPDDKTCFDLFTPSLPPGWISYQFNKPTYNETNTPPVNLAIADSYTIRNKLYGYFEIAGSVRNNDTVTANFVTPTATLYDASGTVIACSYAWIDNPTLNLSPKQTSTFQINFPGIDYDSVYSYRLQVNSQLP